MLSGPFGLTCVDFLRPAAGELTVYTYIGGAPRRQPWRDILCVTDHTDGDADVADAYATDPAQAEQAARWLLDFCTVRG